MKADHWVDTAPFFVFFFELSTGVYVFELETFKVYVGEGSIFFFNKSISLS